MKPTALALAVLLFVSGAIAGDLTFLSKATLTTSGHDYSYKAYVDLSTKHAEGAYQTVTLYSYFDQPISINGYDGVRWWKNTFQVDCKRNVKRVTYIAYLDNDKKKIVDQSMPNAQDDAFETDESIDSRVKPYLCQ